MKRYVTTVCLIVLIVSCQEDISEINLSFSKVFTIDAWSHGKDLIEANNGDLILIGDFDKEFFLWNDDIDQGGFVYRTDPDGNVLIRKNLYFSRGELEERVKQWRQNLGMPELTGKIVLEGNEFHSITELNNGNLFLLGASWGKMDGIDDIFNYYYILDPDLSVLKFQFLDNTPEEIQSSGGRYIWLDGPKPALLEDGDILLYSGFAVYETDRTPFPGIGLIRLNEDGIFQEAWDIPIRDGGWIQDWAFDERGNVILYGSYSEPNVVNPETTRDNDLILYEVDLSSGAILKEVIFGKGNYNIAFNGGIQPTANGFVMSDYHLDTVGTSKFDPDKDGFRNLIGGLWFVDQNLDSIRKTQITDDIIHRQQGKLIKTRDGGFVTYYHLRLASGDHTLVVKSDESGNKQWEHRLEVPLWGNTTLIEAQDGGILIWGRSDFNSLGQRSLLIKLDENGKL